LSCRLRALAFITNNGARDADLFGGVFGECAGIRDHGNDPFAGITRLPHRERMAPDIRRIEPVHQGTGRGCELVACKHIMHTGHRQRRRGIDRDDARGRMLRRQDRDMQQAFERDVRDEMAVAGDEATILANAPIGRDKAEGRGIGVHFDSTTGSPACVAGRGVLAIRRRRRRIRPPR
jgi:hypothetical protein